MRNMLNIEVQLCGLVFDIILIFFILRHESVGLYSEKIFKLCLMVYTVCIFLDITSIFAIVYSAFIPQLLTEAICKIYLVSLLMASFMGFIYTCSDVLHLRESSEFQTGIRVVLAAGVLFIMMTPISYFHSGRTVYSYGPSTVVTYIFAPMFIIGSLVFTFVYGKQMSAHRRRGIRAWMAIEIVAAVIQFVFPQALLVGFGSSIGLFILYSELENPEVYLDRITGRFSFDTFNLYLKQEFAYIKKFSSIIVCNEEDLKLDDELEKSILVEMSEYLASFANAKLFRLSNNDFALIYDTKEEIAMDEIESAINLDVIRNRFRQPWAGNVYLDTHFLYMPNSGAVSSVEEYIDVYLRNRDSFIKEEEMKLLDDTASQHVREYKQMILEIKDAISSDRFEVFYQPIYSINTETFVSAEALARMRGRDGKLVMPDKFIPIAEETGLIEQIGEKIFSKACNCIRKYELKNKGIEYVEVNLSISQCENPMLSVKYDEIMKNACIEPRDISLEITESSTLNQKRILLDNMNKLMNLGVSFALDDFGTGESNLNYIVDMPVKIVKFDRTMIQDYFKNEKARVVMDATVKMIKELGLSIVAEGVETEEQFEKIRSMGIDYIQGYYFSKPLSENDFIKFIDEKNKITGQ